MKENSDRGIKIEESKNCFNGFNSPTTFSPCQDTSKQEQSVIEERCGKTFAGMNSWVEWNCGNKGHATFKQTNNTSTFTDFVSKSTETIDKIRL